MNNVIKEELRGLLLAMKRGNDWADQFNKKMDAIQVVNENREEIGEKASNHLIKGIEEMYENAKVI